VSYLDTGNFYADVDGKRIAYRELSVGRTALPLVMLVHLAANMDNWGPKLIDALARNRHLILLDLPGVGASEGSVEPSLEESAGHAIDILRALGRDRFDLLGLSMGGMIAQEIVRAHPQSVRKLILVGTAPRGGTGVDRVTSVTFGHMLHAAIRREDMKRYIFFTDDETGEAAASATFARLAVPVRARVRPRSRRVPGVAQAHPCMPLWRPDVSPSSDSRMNNASTCISR
jgi:pimeloyl-ACP methyl ester carboxylesterase